MSTTASTIAADPIMAAFGQHKEKIGTVDKLIAKRKPLIVNLTKQQAEFDRAKSALEKTQSQLQPIDSQLTILLGVSGKSSQTVAPASTTTKLRRGKEQSPMHEYVTQAILDSGPLEIKDIATKIVALGFKSNSKDVTKVIAQTLDVDSKKHARFAVHGQRKPRGNKWTLGNGNARYDDLPAEHK